MALNEKHPCKKWFQDFSIFWPTLLEHVAKIVKKNLHNIYMQNLLNEYEKLNKKTYSNVAWNNKQKYNIKVVNCEYCKSVSFLVF